MSVIVSIATNDDHGNDTGRISAIQIGDAIDLHWGEMYSEPRYSIRDHQLRLQRQNFAISGSHTWYGNWCWNAVSMDDAEAAKLLNHLSKDDRWHCEGGWCDLTDAYTEGKVEDAMLDGVLD
jgi:hypothetical protein